MRLIKAVFSLCSLPFPPKNFLFKRIDFKRNAWCMQLRISPQGPEKWKHLLFAQMTIVLAFDLFGMLPMFHKFHQFCGMGEATIWKNFGWQIIDYLRVQKKCFYPRFEYFFCFKKQQQRTCLNCSSKLQLFWPPPPPPPELLPFEWWTGELRCELGVAGCDGGRADGVVKPGGGGSMEPTCRRLARICCGELIKSLVCLLIASNVCSGGSPANKALGSRSISLGSSTCWSGGLPGSSSFIKSRRSCEMKPSLFQALKCCQMASK